MCDRYEKLVKRATSFAIFSAVVLIFIKLLTWWITGSVSLLASLLDSSMDLLASGINFILVRYSLKPADKEHTFGHGKAESLAALAQSAFIMGSAVFLLLHSLNLLVHPVAVELPILGIITSVISMVTCLFLITYQRYVIKITGSQAIKADMLHYLSDLLVNIAVILALILSLFGFIYGDAIFALLIGCAIFYSAIKIILIATQDLLDKALPDEDKARILEIVSLSPEIYGVHDLKTRRSGQMTFIQLHLELDDLIPLVEAHAIADRIEKRISAEFAPAEVIIHQDPISVVPKEKAILGAK